MTPIVTTKQGRLRGISKRGAFSFRGIPFAAPPVGALRFRPPQPAASWDGVRDASEFGPICPQVLGGMEQLTGAKQQLPEDEDCLSLNVWTPDPGGSGLPVMVWIHGGGFSTGSGRVPWYDGANFARDGVVVVTINYRLNALGFLHLEEQFGDEFAGSGNAGILDQVAALEWVQDNIAAFGGDPANVTIFGESAGGGSVGTLLGIAGGRGVFHKAIPQSGAGHWASDAPRASRIAGWILREAGVDDADGLRAVSVDVLREAVGKLGVAVNADPAEVFGEDFAGFALPFQPVVDGRVVSEVPIASLQSGAASRVPVLVGTTREEWKLFTILSSSAPTVRAPRPLRNLCAQNGRSADDVVAAYEARVGGTSELDVRNAIETDRVFRLPAIRLAEAQAAAGAWMYRFDWKSTGLDGRLGACHALEIPFVFDNLSAPGVELFTGGEAPQSVASEMHAAWVAFASSGDPGWPRYDTSRRATKLFDTNSTVADDPDGDTRELWEGLL